MVPPEPGNFSAVGMLLADARLDLSKTFVGVLDEGTVTVLEAVFTAMEHEARAALVRDFDARFPAGAPSLAANGTSGMCQYR